MKKSWPVAVIASVGASMCCIGPVLAAATGLSLLGTAGAWLSPWRFPFTVLALLFLVFAWFRFWRDRRVACNCGEPRPRPWGLMAVTVAALGLLAYPALAEKASPGSKAIKTDTTAQAMRIEVGVQGMSCSSCARGVDKTLSKLPGVRKSATSYEGRNTRVELDSSKIAVSSILAAIRELGYEANLMDSAGKAGRP